MAEFRWHLRPMAGQIKQFVWKKERRCDLWSQITGRNAVVAVKLNIVEGCGDAMPARHSGGFCSADARQCDSDNVAEAQRLADQNDFKLDGLAKRKLLGTKKIDSGGTDVAGDKRYRKFLGHSTSTAKTQREIQAGTRVFALLRVHAHGMRWYTNKTPRLGRAHKRRQAQRREARRIWNQLWPSCGFRGSFGRFVRPRFE
jgi:hypothetical protein